MNIRKIFYNACSYDEYSGWYICNVQLQLPKMDKEEYLDKRLAAVTAIQQEMLDVVLALGLVLEEDEDIGLSPVLNFENGKKLTEELLRRGWEKQFIPIGP